MKIYLAMACWNYEGSNVVRAFKDRDACLAFVSACTDYHATVEHAPAEDDEFDAWMERHEKWKAQHPAGSFSSCDSFALEETDLV